MTRCRYWRLSIEELKKVTYDPKKVLVWEIKCSKDDSGAHFAIFSYRNGTPWDYKEIKGIVFYYNMISRDEVNKISEFLKGKFGGDPKEKGERVFLVGSSEIYSANDISNLAAEIGNKFETGVEISVELENFTPQEQEQSNFPSSKLLPIPGK
ncbi:MAG: hypothetical protein ACRD94_02355 [Nitrosopumilaceae archaeon]